MSLDVTKNSGMTPIQMEFDQQVWAQIDIHGRLDDIPNLAEYFIAPAFGKDKDGKIIVTDYSFVHYTHLPPPEIMKEKIKQVEENDPLVNPEDL